jgi:integrase/recombinase XerD
VLQIRDAKGGKDRQVPVSGPLRARMDSYREQVAGQPGWDWFFPGTTAGQPLTSVCSWDSVSASPDIAGPEIS